MKAKGKYIRFGPDKLKKNSTIVVGIAIQIRINSSTAYQQAEQSVHVSGSGGLTISSVMPPPHTPPIESRVCILLLLYIYYILYWYVLKISTPVGWFSAHTGERGLIFGTLVGWFSAHVVISVLISGTPVCWLSVHFGDGGLISGTPVGWFSAHLWDSVLIFGTPAVLIFNTRCDKRTDFQYTCVLIFSTLPRWLCWISAHNYNRIPVPSVISGDKRVNAKVCGILDFWRKPCVMHRSPSGRSIKHPESRKLGSWSPWSYC